MLYLAILGKQFKKTTAVFQVSTFELTNYKYTKIKNFKFKTKTALYWYLRICQNAKFHIKWKRLLIWKQKRLV